MEFLVLKLVLTPVLVLAASLASRRWGQAIGGWLVGLPLTSGPIAFFIAVEQGTQFAAKAAEGSLAGTAAQACFCLGYGVFADRSWAVSLLAGSFMFAAAGAALNIAHLGLPALVVLVAASLAVALWLMPRRAIARGAAMKPPAWDLPARMAMATGLVLALTTMAPLLGPRLSGLLATFPVFAMVLAVFAHRHHGAAAARSVLSGLLAGLVAFASVFLVLSLGLERLGIADAFIFAGMVGVVVQACSLRGLQKDRRAQHGSE